MWLKTFKHHMSFGIWKAVAFSRQFQDIRNNLHAILSWNNPLKNVMNAWQQSNQIDHGQLILENVTAITFWVVGQRTIVKLQSTEDCIYCYGYIKYSEDRENVSWWGKTKTAWRFTWSKMLCISPEQWISMRNLHAGSAMTINLQ